jgi:hypothetical protein
MEVQTPELRGLHIFGTIRSRPANAGWRGRVGIRRRRYGGNRAADVPRNEYPTGPVVPASAAAKMGSSATASSATRIATATASASTGMATSNEGTCALVP